MTSSTAAHLSEGKNISAELFFELSARGVNPGTGLKKINATALGRSKTMFHEEIGRTLLVYYNLQELKYVSKTLFIGSYVHLALEYTH